LPESYYSLIIDLWDVFPISKFVEYKRFTNASSLQGRYFGQLLERIKIEKAKGSN
jgi:hypothetical protein